MSDLRTRIAAAVVSVIGNTLGSGTELGLDVADAVIAELGLEEELPVGDVAAHGATTTPPGYWYDKDGTKADDE
jgi:hypothetical protein